MKPLMFNPVFKKKKVFNHIYPIFFTKAKFNQHIINEHSMSDSILWTFREKGGVTAKTSKDTACRCLNSQDICYFILSYELNLNYLYCRTKSVTIYCKNVFISRSVVPLWLFVQTVVCMHALEPISMFTSVMFTCGKSNNLVLLCRYVIIPIVQHCQSRLTRFCGIYRWR